MACPFASEGTEMPPDHPPVNTNVSQRVEEQPIPQPPPTFLLRNFPDMVGPASYLTRHTQIAYRYLQDPDFPSRGIQRLANLYGEIYQVDLGRRVIVVSSQALINEVSDQDRFHKDIGRVLEEVRALTGDGLFTSAHE